MRAHRAGVRTGSPHTRLIVLRGNSGSGKTTVARAVRARYGRGVAVVSQDVLRRDVLGEADGPSGANCGLVDTVTRYALDHGFHVVLEGILNSRKYAEMLRALGEEHRGLTRYYYFDVPFEETLRRHASRPQAAEFGEAEMREWWRPGDLLEDGVEALIPAASALPATVARLMRETGLDTAADDPNTPASTIS